MLHEETTADDNHFNTGRHETCSPTLKLMVAKLRYYALETLQITCARYSCCIAITGIIIIIIISSSSSSSSIIIYSLIETSRSGATRRNGSTDVTPVKTIYLLNVVVKQKNFN